MHGPNQINPWRKHPLATDAGPGCPTTRERPWGTGAQAASLSPSGSEDDRKAHRKGYALILHVAALVSRAWSETLGRERVAFPAGGSTPARQVRPAGCGARPQPGRVAGRDSRGPQAAAAMGAPPAPPAALRARSGAAGRSPSLHRPPAGAPQPAWERARDRACRGGRRGRAVPGRAGAG